MGEVRVRVSLTNAVDEGLVWRGQMSPEHVRTEHIEALVDSGAVNCVLPPFVADKRGRAG